MTEEELIADIRAVARTCRGPLPSGARAYIAELLQRGDKGTARIVDVYNRGREENVPFVVRLGTLPRPGTADMHEFVFSDGSIRTDVQAEICGYDFNNIIADGPFDGQGHTYTCPQCGVTGFYHAPLLE